MRNILVVTLLAMVMSACQTPPEAMRAGEAGVVMTSALHESVVRYDSQLQATLTKQLMQLEDAGESAGFDNAAGEQASRAAGQHRSLALIAQLRESSDLSRRDVELGRARSLAAQQLRERLTAPLAKPNDKLNASTNAFAQFTSELSDQERARIAFEFARGLYREVKADQPATTSPLTAVNGNAAAKP